MKKNPLVDEKEFICGWAAAATNIILTYPIQKISALQVINHENITLASKHIVNGWHIRWIYRGILPPLCQKSLSISCMFGFYNNLFNYLTRKNVKHARFLSGLASGTMESTIMPFERMQSILINKKFNKKYKNMLDVMINLNREYGFKEYYRGFSLIFFRNVLGNICFFTLKHESDYYISESLESPFFQNVFRFIHGGIIGAFLSTIFYPLTVLKLELQKEVGTKHFSPLKAFKDVYSNEKKLRHFYRGGFMNGARSFLSWGIINSSYEIYSKLLFE
ncbi:mitochondrial nicotinamide adenine dinucleotide transporter SLC25A51-like [Coccinella septempunctata]|uniref:mitochondrial nicotinamide adenine dinucleotide transporter SLC25A51-like n=1 Tax=Coccinella septempunctata TaxID=41139 RepID=UPI001D078B8F|nr:mitochondrial nicotinamide adenine dinucleotide transporter SLC25A51-like [Coccinella septempunctata]